jgi:hypothetical protein
MADITLSKGGTAERTIDAQDIDVPDLWHIAMALKNGEVYLPHARTQVSEMVLECWHLCHDLKRHIQS